jgi:hypothetical protein
VSPYKIIKSCRSMRKVLTTRHIGRIVFSIFFRFRCGRLPPNG